MKKGVLIELPLVLGCSLIDPLLMAILNSAAASCPDKISVIIHHYVRLLAGTVFGINFFI